MAIYEKMHYKECFPDDTIQRLKKILDDCGIEIVETVPLTSSINTQSLRISIKGTDIGTNGKGMNNAYARASAYAEFFERFQNAILGHTMPNSAIPFVVASDERMMSPADLFDKSNSNAFFDFYFSERGMLDSSLAEKIKRFTSVNRFDKSDPCGMYLTLPFYSVKNQKVVYLPYSSYSAMYGSNGMCAGNTREEALVQGLSEIVERIVQRRIFLEKPALPDMPLEYIQKYPDIYEMFVKANSNPKYTVFIKDCSFGGKYPVVALCIIEKNTGKYGLKLGCHPNIGIALERTFTEITQGIDIFEYSRKRSWLDFSNNSVDTPDNISNSFKIGLSQYPYQLFAHTPDYPFTDLERKVGQSNADILKSWIYDFLPEYDILIRDVSYTGFPSFHIIIPGLSEMQRVTDFDFRVRNTRSFVAYLLSHPEEIHSENVKYIIGVLKAYSSSIYENSLSTYFPPDFITALPFAELGSDVYLLAMCYVLKGRYTDAKQCISLLRKRAKSEHFNVDDTCRDMLDCIYYYLSGMCEIGDHKNVMEYLHTFFTNDLCDRVDWIFNKPDLVVQKQYSDIIVRRLPYFDDFRCKLAAKYGHIKLDQMDNADMFD